jgi:hypothetical protein
LLREGKRGEDRTYLSATNVNVNRSSNHLSVCGAVASGGVLPIVDARERSVDFDPSIFLKLARWQMYLIRMATMQTPPTAQQLSTVVICTLAGSGLYVEEYAIETYLGQK